MSVYVAFIRYRLFTYMYVDILRDIPTYVCKHVYYMIFTHEYLLTCDMYCSYTHMHKKILLSDHK